MEEVLGKLVDKMIVKSLIEQAKGITLLLRNIELKDLIDGKNSLYRYYSIDDTIIVITTDEGLKGRLETLAYYMCPEDDYEVNELLGMDLVTVPRVDDEWHYTIIVPYSNIVLNNDWSIEPDTSNIEEFRVKSSPPVFVLLNESIIVFKHK